MNNNEILAQMLVNKVIAVGFYHIPYTPEFVHDVFRRALGFCRIGKVMMETLHLAGKIGAVFVRVVTNRDEVIKRNIDVLINIV